MKKCGCVACGGPDPFFVLAAHVAPDSLLGLVGRLSRLETVSQAQQRSLAALHGEVDRLKACVRDLDRLVSRALELAGQRTPAQEPAARQCVAKSAGELPPTGQSGPAGGDPPKTANTGLGGAAEKPRKDDALFRRVFGREPLPGEAIRGPLPGPQDVFEAVTRLPSSWVAVRSDKSCPACALPLFPARPDSPPSCARCGWRAEGEAT